MTDRLSPRMYLWTPLVGFDKNLPGYGAQEYLNKLGYVPDAVSLFVFNPDIVNLHEGMAREEMLPLTMSNYHGSIRNELREIQQWSNYELRGLCDELHRRGVKPLMGLMGVDNGEPKPVDLGAFSPHCYSRQRFLRRHPELFACHPSGVANLNVLKRFADGGYYEDYFARKLAEALIDYHMAGVHLADAIMPQGPSAWCVDFSDDMFDQFRAFCPLQLPEEIVRPIADGDAAGLARRSAYIWARHRLAWLRFMAWRWERFMKTVCDALHARGLEVAANGFWCTEPFEAYYRYGVDYKALYRAGLDHLLLEDQASSVYVADALLDAPYNMQKYNLLPLLTRAFAPEGGLLGFSGVKDSTEEWSMLLHMPCALEREIYSLPSTFLLTRQGLRRSLDGFLVCLADGMTAGEWDWLRGRYDLSCKETPAEVLTPTLVFSDSHVYDFLPHYIATRRWSHFKQLHEFASRGGQVGAAVRIEDLDLARGALFVPNIDVLPPREVAAIAAYDRGPIIVTFLAASGFALPGRTPDCRYEDRYAQLPLCVMAYDLGYFDARAVADCLARPDEGPELAGEPMLAAEPTYFTYDMTYQKVSDGFACACALLLRAAYRAPIGAEQAVQLLPMRMADGRYRLLLGNNWPLNYCRPVLKAARRIRRVRPYSQFPALPPKLIVEDRALLVPADERAYEAHRITGFLHKIPPFGASIVDVWLDETEKERGEEP